MTSLILKVFKLLVNCKKHPKTLSPIATTEKKSLLKRKDIERQTKRIWKGLYQKKKGEKTKRYGLQIKKNKTPES